MIVKKDTFLLLAVAGVMMCGTIPAILGYAGVYIKIIFIGMFFLLMFPMRRESLNRLGTVAIQIIPFLICEIVVVRSASYSNGLLAWLQVIFLIVVVIVPFYCFEEGKQDLFVKLFWILVLSFTFTQITTIINIQIDPSMARYAINGSISIEEAHNISKLNIGGYEFAYTTPILTTVLFELKKQRKLSNLLFVFHVIVCVIFLVQVQFTLALLIYFITLIVLFFSNGNPKRAVALVLISLIVLTFSRVMLAEVLNKMASLFSSNNIHDRIEEVAMVLTGNINSTLDAQGRLKLYSMSLKSFMQDPIFGGWLSGASIGGHSGVFDFLGKFGIVGIGIIMLAISPIAHLINAFRGQRVFYNMAIMCYMLFGIYSIVNPSIGYLQLIMVIWLPIFGLKALGLDENNFVEGN